MIIRAKLGRGGAKILYDIIIVIQIIVLTLLLLIFIYKYILILLILIELLVINITFLIFLIYRKIYLEFYLIYYLVFRVCEGVLGLRMLVIIVRYYGNELYYIFNIRKF